MNSYIHQHKLWPNFFWRDEEILKILGIVRNIQGKLLGRMELLGFKLRDEALLENLTLDVLKNNEIEGEILDPAQVRSSIARHLGMEIAGLVHSDRHVDGVVEMMLDATENYNKPISKKRLFNWHASLFPAGRSGMYKIIIANWRDDKTGPMQVVSGPMGKEKVHYQAPDASIVDNEMAQFIKWFNSNEELDPVLKSAIAHLWFITIHPFEDGNGRIARTLADMLLARADQSNKRFYSMSSQIRLERNKYYDILEKTQKGNLDITDWLLWFFNCLMNAINATENTLSQVMLKVHYWKKHAATHINLRQRLMINKMLDGFDGKVTSSKWAKITKCSTDTALRDIQDLIEKQMLKKEIGGGRSTNYELTDD